MLLKFKYVCLLIIGALFLLNSQTYSQLSFEEPSFKEALIKARNENKRIIVDVYTDWCVWCKRMDADTYSNEGVEKIIENSFVFVKLDAEGKDKIKYKDKEYTEEELTVFFEVSGYPTIVFLEPDGSVIEFKYDSVTMKNIPGYYKAKEFKKILKYFKNGKYRESDLSAVF